MKSYDFIDRHHAATTPPCFGCGREIEKRAKYFLIRENSYCLDCGTNLLIAEMSEMAEAMDGYRMYWREREPRRGGL